MAQNTFTGPLRSGSATRNTVGLVELSQRATLTANGASQVNATLLLPAGATILTILVDVLTAFNGLTAPITVGTAALGTQYASAVSGLATGRTNTTNSATAAQLTAMQATATDANAAGVSSVVVSVAPTGANTTGQVAVTVLYVQNPTADYI